MPLKWTLSDGILCKYGPWLLAPNICSRAILLCVYSKMKSLLWVLCHSLSRQDHHLCGPLNPSFTFCLSLVLSFLVTQSFFTPKCYFQLCALLPFSRSLVLSSTCTLTQKWSSPHTSMHDTFPLFFILSLPTELEHTHTQIHTHFTFAALSPSLWGEARVQFSSLLPSLHILYFISSLCSPTRPPTHSFSFVFHFHSFSNSSDNPRELHRPITFLESWWGSNVKYRYLLLTTTGKTSL